MNDPTLNPNAPPVERATYTEAEFAKLLGVHPDTLAAHRKKLPQSIRLGRRYLYPRDAVHDFIRSGGVAK